MARGWFIKNTYIPIHIYIILTVEGDEYTHMPFYSRIDLTAGRITLTLTAVILTLSAWFKPDFLHETVIYNNVFIKNNLFFLVWTFASSTFS